MQYLFVIPVVMVSVLLVLAILVQNPKSGGLGMGFARLGSQVVGTRKANAFIGKFTWTMAASLVALCLSAGLFFK